MEHDLPTSGKNLQRLLARVNYESHPWPTRAGMKLDLLRELLVRMGNPERRCPVVHVAGTKGKGTTTRLIADMASAAGYQTGTYTSPHLEHFNERISLNGTPVSSETVEQTLGKIWPVVDLLDVEMEEKRQRRLTFFDIATALALQIFADQNLDLVVLETGMGGRLDSTNICQPVLCLITSISLDHCRQLGSNVVSIAREKAGIVKKGVPVICGVDPHNPAAHEIAATARQLNAPLLQIETGFAASNIVLLHRQTEFTFSSRSPKLLSIDSISLNMLGQHAAQNAALAIAAIQILREMGFHIDDFAIRTACQKVCIPGRIEIVSRNPLVVLDVAHNPASVAALRATLLEQVPEWSQASCRTALCAISRDKDQRSIIAQLLEFCDRVVFTRFLDNPRATPPGELATIATEILTERSREGLSDNLLSAVIETTETPLEGWLACQEQLRPGTAVCVTGSVFLVAELRRAVRKTISAAWPIAEVPAAEGPATAVETPPVL